MQKLKLLIPLALLISGLFVACHEDDPLGNNQTADVTFAGQIINENGDGVEGALVKAGDESALTDKNGVFRLKQVRLAAMHAMVTVSKPGYFEVSRPYIVEDEALQTITIQLLTKTYAGAVNTATGGQVNISGGPKLDFPAFAFSDANGNAYNGQVSVYGRYLDPSDPNLGLFIPGDMTAENASDEEVFLATYGMVAVEIEGASGQKLKIASGKEVELRMPILASQSASAPNEIPLWYYDLEEGHWHEEGTAQKVGNEYVGMVKHFSFWNCDAPFPLTQLHGTIYLENVNQPLTNALVRITMVSTGASSFGYTDGDGKFGGCVPKDEALTLEVMEPIDCGSQVLYTQNIGPFAGETTLPDITLSALQIPIFKVNGQLLDCAGQAVANGYVKITLGDSKYFLHAEANGQFEFAMVGCGSTAQTGEATGYDLANLLESAPTPLSTPPNSINLGTLTVCTALTEYIQYTLDGQTFTKISPFGVLDATSTFIASEDSTQNNAYIQFNFENNGQTGTFPLRFLQVNQLFYDISFGTVLTTDVTTYGNVGDLITGSFSGTFQQFSNGASHTISCNYRVIRE
jgi:hypothetical protein